MEDAAWLVGCSVKRVSWSGGVGECFEERGGGKAFVPLGVIDELGCGKDARRVVFGKDKDAEEDTLGFADGVVGVGADAFNALGGSLFEFLAEDSGVNAEFLCGVRCELVALQRRGYAADMRKQKVEGLDLGVGGATRELFAGAVDQVV